MQSKRNNIRESGIKVKIFLDRQPTVFDNTCEGVEHIVLYEQVGKCFLDYYSIYPHIIESKVIK